METDWTSVWLIVFQNISLKQTGWGLGSGFQNTPKFWVLSLNFKTGMANPQPAGQMRPKKNFCRTISN
jgi:hypothetical protein